MEYDRVKILVLAGKTYAEISKILISEAPATNGLSTRSVRRFCNDNNIDKKSLFGKEKIDELVEREISTV